MRYVIPVQAAREAVSPAVLVDVLQSLLESGVIERFEVDPPGSPGSLVVNADAGLEAAFVLASESERRRPSGSIHFSATSESGNPDRVLTYMREGDAGRLRAESTYAYYSQAEAFTHTRAFRKLTARRRAIWRLHASGLSKYEIAVELEVPSGAVKRAVAAVRPLAGLGRATRAIPRGRRQRKR